MAKILIKNGVIIPMDGNSRTIEDKALLLENGRIAAIDNPETFMQAPGIEKTIDANGKVVMPGFVNTHTHIAMSSLCRGIAEDMTEEEYTFSLAIPLMESGIVSEEDYLCFGRLSCVEMLKFGNTCLNECTALHMIDPTATAIEDAGMRGMLGVEIGDGDFSNISEGADVSEMVTQLRFDPNLKDQSLQGAIDLYSRWHGQSDEKISVRFVNFSPIFCSPEILQETKAAASERGIGVNTHALVNQEEAEGYQQLHHKTGTEFLADIGYLDEKTNLVHMICLQDKELQIVKETGAFISHCPHEMGKRGLCAPLGKMYASELNVVLGSDWMMMDPFEQMRFAAVLARVDSGNAKLKSAYEFLEMITIKAAQSIGLGGSIGSLEIGKRADVILVDYDQAHMIPMNRHYDLVNNLVYNAHGSDVSTVIVDGKIVVENGRIQTLDEKQVIADANQRSEAIMDTLKSL